VGVGYMLGRRSPAQLVGVGAGCCELGSTVDGATVGLGSGLVGAGDGLAVGDVVGCGLFAGVGDGVAAGLDSSGLLGDVAAGRVE
jgi:hypothetical protein